MKKLILKKELMPQERGIKNGQASQRGTYILISKRVAGGAALPKLGTETKNPTILLTVTNSKTGKQYSWSYTYHNGKFFEETRDEYRIYTKGLSIEDKKLMLPGNEFRLYKVKGKNRFEFEVIVGKRTSPITQLAVIGEITHAEFDPDGLIDERTFKNVLRAIRSGQGKFRQDLLGAYGGKCTITGADVKECLEAAHIAEYLGTKSNRTDNGLLLRADLHSLFDSGLIGVDPTTKAVVISPKIAGTDMAGSLAGKMSTAPAKSQDNPNAKALLRHLKKHRLIA